MRGGTPPLRDGPVWPLSALHVLAKPPVLGEDDLYNLVCDPAFLLVGWTRVRSNRGARTAGVDGETAHYIEDVRGLEGFLAELRTDLKDRTFGPLPVPARAIPKAGSKVRYLGIATIRDRVVQASQKLVLEPIFEVDFSRVSTGSARSAGHTTRWPRCVTSRPTPTSGSPSPGCSTLRRMST